MTRVVVVLLGLTSVLAGCYRPRPAPMVTAVVPVRSYAPPATNPDATQPPPPPPAPGDPAGPPGGLGATPPPVDPTAATPADLPETLTREELSRSLAGVAAETRACGRGHPQTIMVRLTFASDGTLTSAEAQESARGSAEAACLLGAVRAVRVRPFRANAASLWIPFTIE